VRRTGTFGIYTNNLVDKDAHLQNIYLILHNILIGARCVMVPVGVWQHLQIKLNRRINR